MFFPYITDDCLIKIITGDFDRSAHNNSVQRDHSDIAGTPSDVHNHIAAWSGNIDPCSDGCCDRLLYNRNFSCTCLIGCIFHRLFLDLCNAARHTDTDPRFAKRHSADRFLDKILQHLFGHGIIRNNALTQRANCNDIAWCTPKHQSCLLSDCFDFICITVKGYYGRLF